LGHSVVVSCIQRRTGDSAVEIWQHYSPDVDLMDCQTSVVKLVDSGRAGSRRPYYILFVIDSQIDLRLPGRASGAQT